MRQTIKYLFVIMAIMFFHSSPALADLHIYNVETINPSGPRTQSTIYVYRLDKGKTAKVRGQAANSRSLNLAQVASEHKTFPLTVSAGGLTARSGAAGLISLQGSFLSPPAATQAMPTLLCFTARGFDIRQASVDAQIIKSAYGCLAAIQSPPLFIENGRPTRSEAKPLSWNHVFAARSLSAGSVVIVQGSISAVGLSEFLAGSGRACPAVMGQVTKQTVRIRVLGESRAFASCSLRLKDVATLNLGSTTGAIHYGTRLAGDDTASPPIALLFDD